MMSNLKYADYAVDTVGGAYGLSNIHEILGIIVLILSILSFLAKIVYSIVQAHKNAKFDEISNELDKAKIELEEAQKVIEIIKENKDEN